MTRFRQPLRCLLWLGAMALPLAHQAVAQDNATGRTQPKVFVVPMKGPLYYRMSATELSKVIRAAMVQKPEAFILVISSPGGNREAAFQIAQQIADAFDCRRQTVENVRQRLVERGFEPALNGLKRLNPPTPKLLDGEQEARIIATRLGPPPAGYANWSLRLLASKVVELSIVASISHETVRRTLKKTA